MNQSLNLMTRQSIRRRIKSEAIVLWTRVLVVAVVAMAGVGTLKAWQLEEARQRRVALTAQHQPIQQLRNDLRVLRAQIGALNENERLVLGIAKTPAVLSVLSGVTEAAVTFQGEAYVEELEYSSPDPIAAGTRPQRIEIGGVARDPISVQRFVDALKQSGRFRAVRLGGAEAKLLRGTATTAFEVECVL